jgi:chromosome segregation ATPase
VSFAIATVLEQTDALTRDSKKKEELEQKVHELTQKLDEESVGGARSANAVKDVERRLGRRVEELEQKLKAKSEALINAESKLEELKRLPEQLQAKDEELKSVTRELEYAKQELGQVRDKYGNVNSSLQSSLRRDQDSLSTSEARYSTFYFHLMGNHAI